MITTSFEEKFEELVNLLPKHKNADNSELQIRFDCGSQEKLNEYMAITETISKLPLIWLVEGKDKEDKITGTITRDAKIIIATQSLGASRRTRDVLTAEFRGILNPIKNNLVTVLEQSGISTLINPYGISRIQEYAWNNVKGDDTENATGDVWMVIFMEATIIIDTKKCINTIKF